MPRGKDDDNIKNGATLRKGRFSQQMDEEPDGDEQDQDGDGVPDDEEQEGEGEPEPEDDEEQDEPVRKSVDDEDQFVAVDDEQLLKAVRDGVTEDLPGVLSDFFSSEAGQAALTKALTGAITKSLTPAIKKALAPIEAKQDESISLTKALGDFVGSETDVLLEGVASVLGKTEEMTKAVGSIRKSAVTAAPNGVKKVVTKAVESKPEDAIQKSAAPAASTDLNGFDVVSKALDWQDETGKPVEGLSKAVALVNEGQPVEQELLKGILSQIETGA